MTALPATTRRTRRRGASLVEVMATMAVLVILGGILAPTFRTMSRDSKSKAGADTLRGRIADARGAAVEGGRPYRLAISTDGKKVRVAPDEQAFVNMAANADDDDNGPMIAESALPADVTATTQHDDGSQATPDDAGWVRVATFQPDGTCREDSATVKIAEPGSRSIYIRIRGLTGAAVTESGPAPGKTS